MVMLRGDPEETKEKKLETEIIEEKEETDKVEEKTSSLYKSESQETVLEEKLNKKSKIEE